MTSDYSIHPAADAFPMMPPAELDALAQDIKANGQQKPIERMGDQILDGRNRLEACRRAGIEPTIIEVQTEDPVGYVISANMHRRQLEKWQRAIIFAALANVKRGSNRYAKKVDATNVASKTESTMSDLAEQAGISKKSIERAKRLLEEQPEALDMAKRGIKPKAKKATGLYWIRIALAVCKEETGMTRSQTWVNSNLRDKLEERLQWMREQDGRKQLTEDQAQELRSAVTQILAELPVDTEDQQAQQAEARAALGHTDESKLERAIRVHKRALDKEQAEKVQQEVKRLLDEELLPMYAKEYARYKTFNDAYRGVMTHTEYKLLTSFLHPDKNPNDPVKAARLFNLIREKEEILCGIKESDKGARLNELPKTAAELLARRRKEMH